MQTDAATQLGVDAATIKRLAMTAAVRCPICNSEATEIDRGLFDGVGFDCKFHGRFRVSGTVLAQRKGRTRRQWEHALMLARARASETTTPLISSELISARSGTRRGHAPVPKFALKSSDFSGAFPLPATATDRAIVEA